MGLDKIARKIESLNLFDVLVFNLIYWLYFLKQDSIKLKIINSMLFFLWKNFFPKKLSIFMWNIEKILSFNLKKKKFYKWKKKTLLVFKIIKIDQNFHSPKKLIKSFLI